MEGLLEDLTDDLDEVLLDVVEALLLNPDILPLEGRINSANVFLGCFSRLISRRRSLSETESYFA